LGPYQVIQRFSVDKLHYYEGTAVLGDPDVRDIDGIGMVDAASGPGLLLDPPGCVRISGELRSEHLYRHSLADQYELSIVKDAHADGAEASCDTMLRWHCRRRAIPIHYSVVQGQPSLPALPAAAM